MMDRTLSEETVLSLVSKTAILGQTLHRRKHQAPVDQGLIDGLDSSQGAKLPRQSSKKRPVLGLSGQKN
jgi:hypothetical protein